MVMMNMPMPRTCSGCPCSYWIQSGRHEGRLMCEAKEKQMGENGYDGDDLTRDCLVNEFAILRPKDCPIVGWKAGVEI